MPSLIALLDANVLYPAELRSFFMYLAIPGVYRAKWSTNIHEELMSNLLINRPDLTRAQLERTRELMDKNAPNAVVTGYESLIPSLSLPDEGDRHVLAAAIQAKANVIVTNNLKDFRPEVLQEFEIEARTPDEFVMNLLDLSRRGCVRGCRSSSPEPEESGQDSRGIPEHSRIARLGAHRCRA